MIQEKDHIDPYTAFFLTLWDLDNLFDESLPKVIKV